MAELKDFISKYIDINNIDTNNVNCEQLKVDCYNKEKGDLAGYDCKLCNNKGDIAFIDEKGNFALMLCKCRQIRSTITKVKKSGISDIIKDFTISKYIATEKWQEDIKNKATEYISSNNKQWFFIGGQVASGKTHICTAIVREFIIQGKDAVYMMWRDEIVPLKASVNDYEEYTSRINKLKNAEVLYIDDFLKVEKGKEPTPADVNVAFEILNYRYNNPDLLTIISSEFTIERIIDIDEAVGSRIYQRSKEFQTNIAPDKSKNYRLR